jgi:hypothetical protein
LRRPPRRPRFYTNWLRDALSEAKIEAVIPLKCNRRFPADFDKET